MSSVHHRKYAAPRVQSVASQSLASVERFGGMKGLPAADWVSYFQALGGVAAATAVVAAFTVPFRAQRREQTRIAASEARESLSDVVAALENLRAFLALDGRRDVDRRFALLPSRESTASDPYELRLAAVEKAIARARLYVPDSLVVRKPRAPNQVWSDLEDPVFDRLLTHADRALANCHRWMEIASRVRNPQARYAVVAGVTNGVFLAGLDLEENLQLLAHGRLALDSVDTPIAERSPAELRFELTAAQRRAMEHDIDWPAGALERFRGPDPYTVSEDEFDEMLRDLGITRD